MFGSRSETPASSQTVSAADQDRPSPGGMHPLAVVSHTNQVPDETLAQAVGAQAGWHRDDKGVIYCQDGVYVADSLTECAEVMREAGWFLGEGRLTGVHWAEIDRQVAAAFPGDSGDQGGKPHLWGDFMRERVTQHRRAGNRPVSRA